ncbi:MAG: thiol-activated cytolysin family protein, partial [Myxococcota bacterium]
VFTFESEYSTLEMGSALEFAYQGGADISGDVSVTYADMVNQSNITAYILGGSGQDAVQVIDGFEALQNFIRSGGNYSRDSPGAPIAYKLSYLADNAPARLSFTQDYRIRDCVRVSQKIRVTLDSITVEASSDEVGSGGDLEIYGTVRAIGDNEVALFDRPSESFIRIDEGQTYTTPSGIIGEGVLQVTPEDGSEIRLIADVRERDTLNADDNFPDQLLPAAYETGWRRTVDIIASSDGARVRLTLSLEPI